MSQALNFIETFGYGRQMKVYDFETYISTCKCVDEFPVVLVNAWLVPGLHGSNARYVEFMIMPYIFWFNLEGVFCNR